MLTGYLPAILTAIAGFVAGWLWQRWRSGARLREAEQQGNQALEAAEREMERLCKDWQAYQQQVQDVHAEIDKLKRANADLDTEIEEMAAKHVLALRERDDEITRLRELSAAADQKLVSLTAREEIVAQTQARMREEDQSLRAEMAARDERIRQLDEHLNQMAPLLAEVSQLRNQAAEADRRVKRAETALTERDAELALLRLRMAELEPMPALLVDRDNRLREQEQRQRGVLAALEARIEDYEATMLKMENRLAAVAQMETELAAARHRLRETEQRFEENQQRSVKLLDERGAEIRALKQRIAELEAVAGRDVDHRLNDALRRAEAAEVKARGLETRQEVLLAERDQKIAALEARLAEPRALAMGAAAGAGSSVASSRGGAHPPADPAPAKLHGRLQELLFLRPIDFAPGTCEFVGEAFAVLDEIAVLVRATAGVTLVVVEGHTDAHGDPYLNWTLSYWRAEAVRRYLAERGVPEGIIRAVGHGGSRPVADNETEDGRARNRRIEIRIAGGAARAHTM